MRSPSSSPSLALSFALVFASCGGDRGGAGSPESPAGGSAHSTHGAEHSHGGMPHRFERAEDWARLFDDPGRAEWQKPDEVVALAAIAPGMTAVDIGAGTGYFMAGLS